MSERKHMLLIDYDEYAWCHRENRLEPHELLELVRVDAKRFLRYPQMGGLMVIKRSRGGFHLKAPLARLTEEEQSYFIATSFGDTGYAYWSSERGKSTLRIGDKTITRRVGDRLFGHKVHDVPYVLEVIRN